MGEAQEAQNHAAPQETRQAQTQALMEGSSSSSCSARGPDGALISVMQQRHTQHLVLARLLAWVAMCVIRLVFRVASSPCAMAASGVCCWAV